MQEHNRLVSSVSVPKRSGKPGPDAGFYLNPYVPSSNCPYVFELLPILLPEVSAFPKLEEYEGKERNKYEDERH